MWLAEAVMPFDWVPQLEVLPLSDALVTPGGMGSVMESVAFGVPMVVVPVFASEGRAERERE